MSEKPYTQTIQKLSICALLLAPFVAMAQPTTFKEFVALIINLINLAIPVLFGVVFLFLAWKVFDSWVIHAGDEAKRQDGKKYALTAVLVVVLMLSAWGVVLVIRESLLGI